MNIKQIENILFNPLFTSKLLLMALAGSKSNQLKVELIYFILPMVYNDIIRSKLTNSKKTSTLNTLLNQEVKRELIIIDDLIINYKIKTKEALITLSNTYNVEIADYLVLKENQELTYSKEENSTLRDYYKAAFNLGSIFSKEDYRKIFFNL
ncbi:hypothetical protein CGC58_09975 [Capnocytophaga stomatis]|uniref:Uncharacterized protein n=1 Tax=Capnocytophaga stomatis TaxID=1848904 RepID=A0A250FXX2_9FLAO|nr:three component ABC system middle component [Capnocytophaga stomatis]ATA90019.1 hypothetical protein CGC58_09975 [Capnocytophaga stomatis]GIM50634.1 hypothetical protein CAPN003_20860 [Capnocytophaga stomatis]